MKKIKLTQGKYALVDDADYKWLNQWKWYASKQGNTWYAYRAIWKLRKTIGMHRLILGLDFGDKRQGDHINRNGLNNQRCNLRITTHQQNHFNNGAKGYGFHRNRWEAYININDKKIHLGKFKTEQEAKQVRQEAKVKYFGEFAHGYKVQRAKA